ncbi:MAG TPA: DUF2127 domain-containing protein [Candidatus Paceibacterota bacterium]|nr:DUF2127 domain-containing protein [Candidatus Paceibacterota bacterium]
MTLASLKNYLLEEKHMHLFFVVSLWAKGLFALSEIIGGIAAFFITKQFLVDIALWITKHEFAEDPHDVIANYFLHSVQNLSIGAQDFAAIYLLGHGVIKLWLIIGLLRERLWYYPTALVVFGLFIVYQLYRYTFTHSIWLLLITVIDLIVIGLTWHEWGYLRKHRIQ